MPVWDAAIRNRCVVWHCVIDPWPWEGSLQMSCQEAGGTWEPAGFWNSTILWNTMLCVQHIWVMHRQSTGPQLTTEHFSGWFWPCLQSQQSGSWFGKIEKQREMALTLGKSQAWSWYINIYECSRGSQALNWPPWSYWCCSCSYRKTLYDFV